jgi:hypothetical protein
MQVSRVGREEGTASTGASAPREEQQQLSSLLAFTRWTSEGESESLGGEVLSCPLVCRKRSKETMTTVPSNDGRGALTVFFG